MILLRQDRSPGAAHVWGKGLAMIMGVRIRHLTEKPKEMGDLIVSNHMGFLDIPILSSFFPARYIIKDEASHVFYFGKALVLMGHLFVKRTDSKSKRLAGVELYKRLEQNQRFIVFPEGRAWPKATRLPFLPGSFSAAKKTNKTVQLCVIDYLPDRRTLEWDVNKSTSSQLVALFGKRRVDIGIKFFPPELVKGTAQEIADRYKSEVERTLAEHDRQRDKENSQ